jgi:diguanylate cyclase (GGDEF)-like protein
MSFRRRLTVAVLLILVVPLGAIAVLLLRLPSESRTGKADARLAGALTPVLNTYQDELEAARAAGRTVGRDRALATAIERGPGPALDAEVRGIATALGLTRLEVRLGGEEVARFSAGEPVADASVTVRQPAGPSVRLILSTTTAEEFARQAREVSRLAAVLAVDGRLVASPGVEPGGFDLGGEVPRSQDAELPSDEYRVRVVSLPDAAGNVRLGLLGPRGSTVLSNSQALIAVLLGACVLLALALIVPMLRDLQRLHERTAEAAATDALTGLSNHRRFQQLIAKEIERAHRFDRPLSLALIDLDDFKQVNDTYGHLAGDEVLRTVAEVLRVESRVVDEPARYGGEEFAIALPETPVEGALEVAERIRRRLERTRISLPDHGGEVTVEASIGVSGTPDSMLDAKSLIEAADAALYQAKREGKNRVVRTARDQAADRVRT